MMHENQLVIKFLLPSHSKTQNPYHFSLQIEFTLILGEGTINYTYVA